MFHGKKSAALLLLCTILLLPACRPRTTASPSPGKTSTPSSTTTAASSQTPTTQTTGVPDLPVLFQNQAEGKHNIKLYIVETKETKEMDVEEYLCGVLAGEMQKDWPEEALKAQAIIARTYLLNFLVEKGKSEYENADISTDIKESQAYDASGVDDKIRKAVQDTKGMAITYDNKYIQAWFSSSAGGKTALAPEGLNYDKENPPYIKVTDSPEDAAPEEFKTWTASFTKDKLTAAFEKMGVTAPTFTKVEIAERGPSGRCTKLRFGTTDVNCSELRIALDSKIFRSTLLTDVKWENNKLTVTGKGYGHGVGMSQWGAFTMAQQGKKAEEIIKYYFQDTQIVSVWK